jgi:hypothetical protein
MAAHVLGGQLHDGYPRPGGGVRAGGLLHHVVHPHRRLDGGVVGLQTFPRPPPQPVPQPGQVAAAPEGILRDG